MRLASIDVGTNSVKLLVADVEDQQIKNILLDMPVITRLGQNLSKDGEILPEAMERTLNAINDFKNKAEDAGAVDVFAIATSAMREAKNSDIFVKMLKEKAGIGLQIVSGEEEAELTFLGACSDYDFQTESLLVIDVGGGSTEFILGQNGNIEDKFSVNIGCVHLTEEFIHTDPIDSMEIQKIIHKTISMLYPKLSSISANMRSLVGIGGTITSLASIHQHIEGFHNIDVHKYVLSKEHIVRLLTYLRRTPLEERRKIQGLQPERADIIVAGAAIFSTIMEILKSQEITISRMGLRYGILIKNAKYL